MTTAIAAAVIFALVAFNRIELSVFTGVKDNWTWLVLAFLLMLPPYVIVSFRFWLVLRNQSIIVPFATAVRWTMIGSFFDIVMPSNSGGDVVKAGYVVRHVGTGSRTKAVIAVAFDRVLGLLGLFLLASLTSIVGWHIVMLMPGGKKLMIFLVLVCIGILLSFLIMGSRRLFNNARFRSLLERLPAGARLFNVITCFNSLRERPKDLILVLGLSMLNHTFLCMALLCITIAFSQSVGLVSGFSIFPLAIFSNAFGFAGGFGVGTAAFDVIFSRLLDIHVGATIGLTFQILSVFTRLIGLPFYLAGGK
jgi:glycosyltransferase 2 family protein